MAAIGHRVGVCMQVDTARIIRDSVAISHCVVVPLTVGEPGLHVERHGDIVAQILLVAVVLKRQSAIRPVVTVPNLRPAVAYPVGRRDCAGERRQRQRRDR